MVGARVRAALGSGLFLVIAPGTVAGVLPWLLTGWESTGPWVGFELLGVGLIVAGVGVLLHAFARFAIEGIGTPAPVAPAEQLVIGGLYRYVRNPMYLAVTATIVGQALLLGRAILLAYALVFMAVVATFVKLYEEPTLSQRFGSQYEEYRHAVPGWWPRVR
jgi:protein-S-isoprenylcysteine O-methyltransferase Ste14